MKKWLFLALVFPVSAFASGLSKPVLVGPKAIGMGGAFVGIADDPTAIYHNPAGITQLKGHQFHLGMDTLITSQEDYTPPGGTAESAKREYLPVPTFGYTTDALRLVTLGLGVYFPHGNGGKFDPSTQNPNNPNEGRIYSMEIAPAVAWQILPQLSLGATLRVVRISSSLKGQALPSGDTLDESNVSGWGVGASAGLLYKPTSWFSVGANYRSKVTATLDGSATFSGPSGLGTQDASVKFPLPTLITAGFAFKPNAKSTLGISYDFERNSEIKTLTLNLPNAGTSIAQPQNYADSHTIHFGGEYWVKPALAFRAGYAKDLNRSIPDTTMNRVVGDIAAHEVSLGSAYKWDRYTFGLTWNARWGERDIGVNGVSNPSPGNYSAFIETLSFGVGMAI